MASRRILEPPAVKRRALQTAGQVATAIFKINTVIKQKDEELKRAGQDILE